MSAFDLPSDFLAAPADPAHALYVRAQALTSADLATEDRLLASSMWFPYRRLSFIDRTHEFVHAYDRACLSLVHNCTAIPDGTRSWMKRRGSYMNPAELLAPWIYTVKTTGQVKLNPKWKQWIAARRTADTYGMTYDDFCYGAVLSAMHRGWSRFPTPAQLLTPSILGTDPADRWPAETVLGYEGKLYGTTIKTTTDPFFQADAWCDDPLQRAYARFIALQIVRLYGDTQEARRRWKIQQSSGKLHASLSLDAALS